MANEEDKTGAKKPLFSPRFTRVYLFVCGGLWAAYFTLIFLNAAGVIRIPPEKDDFWVLVSPLWTWTDDPVLQGIMMMLFGAVLLFLLPGLLVVGAWIGIVTVVASLVIGIAGALIAIYYMAIVWPLWSASPTGKVLAVILGVGVPGFIITLVVRAYGESVITWLTEVAVKIFFIKRKPRKAATAGQGAVKFPSGERALAMPDIKDEEEKLREQMFSLTTLNPSLPPVPTVSTGYRGWIQEAKKRIELRSVYRTREEELKLIQQINVFWEEILRHKKTITELERIDIEKARAAKLEPVKDDATIAEAKLRATKADDERERILAAAERRKNPPAPAPAPPSDRERVEWMYAQKARDHEKYAENPDMQIWSDNEWDDKILKAKDGLA